MEKKILSDASKVRGYHRVQFLGQKEEIGKMLCQGYPQKAVWMELSERHKWTMTYKTINTTSRTGGMNDGQSPF